MVRMPQTENFIDRRSIPAAAEETRWVAPDGWRIRRLDMRADGVAKGSILFLPGRIDCYEKYLELLVQLHADGWNVTSIDWRGQAGSGRFIEDASTGHVDDFEIWLTDLAAFWKEWSGERVGPHVLMGHSMGGHLALRAVAEDRVNPDALALSAPMLGLRKGMLPTVAAEQIPKFFMMLGMGQSPAWPEGETPTLVDRMRQNILTHDPERYGDEQFWFEERPELRMGPASWGWISAAFRSIAALERPGLLEAIDIPVLVVATDADQLVDARETRRVAARIPDVELMMFGQEAAHEIFREADPVRQRAVEKLGEFLDTVRGPATTETIKA